MLFLSDIVLVPNTHIHGGSQLAVTPVPRDLTPSSDLHRQCLHVVHRQTHRQNSHTHKIKGKIKHQPLVYMQVRAHTHTHTKIHMSTKAKNQ